MRTIFTILVVLAGLKVYAHNAIFQDSARTALINAYRSAAVTACKRDARYYPETAKHWDTPRAVELTIGRSTGGVQFWDIHHPQWDEAFKTPFLIVRPDKAAGALTCTYDINRDAAVIASR